MTSKIAKSSRSRRKEMSVIALAGWLLQFASIPLGGDAAHAAQGAPAPDTRPPADKLFAKIYPVFVHARCANCHGVVQHYPGIIRSVTKETHPGGEVTDPLHPTAVDCGQCHDATPKIEKEWQFTAPPIMEWNGMSEEQLCVMQAAQVRLKNGEAGGAGVGLAQSYLHHVATDALIEQAFKGRAGGARAKADPDLPYPPLSYDEFIHGATEWVNAGAPCRAMGTISQVEEQTSAYNHQTMGGKISFEQSAKREVNIVRYADGSATATVTASGIDETVQTTDAGGCEIVTTQRNSWVRVGPPQVDAKVEIEVKPSEYTIRFVLPADSTHTVSTIHQTNTCGAANVTDPPSGVNLIWKPWAMTIHCPKAFPNHDGTMGCVGSEPHDTGAASGALHQTVKDASDAAEPASWLDRSPMATARIDTGEGLPVHVKVIWALRLEQLLARSQKK